MIDSVPGLVERPGVFVVVLDGGGGGDVVGVGVIVTLVVVVVDTLLLMTVLMLLFILLILRCCCCRCPSLLTLVLHRTRLPPLLELPPRVTTAIQRKKTNH